MGIGIAEITSEGSPHERRHPVTQELILGALLTGLVGLIWVMTMSILSDDRQPAKSHDSASVHGDDAQHQDSGLKRRTIAA